MNWIEVFRTGTHTDASGQVRTFTGSDLDRMVSTLDPKFHEPPLVLGHPRTDAPAYGWVSGLKRQGELLLASFRDVPDQVQEWVRAGRYKKRSVSLYPDGRLRHVGLLGAMPPAVQGLADFRAFADGAEGAACEYSEDVEVKRMDEAKIKELQDKLAAAEAEVTRLRAANGGEAAKGKDAEIARLRGELDQLKQAQSAKEAEFAEAQTRERAKATKAKVDELVAAGKLLPANAPAVMAFAERLHGGCELEFSEGAGKKPLSAHFFEFLGGLPSNGLHLDFSERAGSGGQPPQVVDYSKLHGKA